METQLNTNLSKVRVHDDGRAADASRALDASAFTVGGHIFFGARQYRPESAAGRYLLSHELAHVIQQGAASIPHGVDIPMLPAGTSLERDANRTAANGISPAQRSTPALARFRGRVPFPRAQQRLGARDRTDNSLDAINERSNIRSRDNRKRFELERPEATLGRGGQPPDFVTEHGTGRYELFDPHGQRAIVYRIRKMHILDALEYEVARSNTEADLQRIIDRFLPSVGLASRAIEVAEGKRAPLLTPSPTIAALDLPVFKADLDPNGRRRIAALEEAVDRRARQVPKLATSRLVGRKRVRRGCRIEPIEPLGREQDPLASLYCAAVTGSPYSYRISIESTSGTVSAVNRWAEIDALRGDTWFECKCGYEALLFGQRGEGRAASALQKLDKQVLNHADIARTCGLEYRFIVSNARVAELLRDRWLGNVAIEVRPWEPCD